MTTRVSPAPVSEREVEDAVADLVERFPPDTTERTKFLAAQYDAGLAWVNFDPGFGGLGADPALQLVIERVLDAAGAPPAAQLNPLGVMMAGPTVHAHGTDEQRRRLLRPLFSSTEIWCQLFSEPGAGSDLASLSTSAVRDGDEWVVNGQKVWTSLAHHAQRGMLVARSDPSQPKHRGLIYFALDMQLPGVEVRPLRQMTGEAEFNEVYLTDVRVPDRDRLGEPGDGWRVALTTLMNERVSIGGRPVQRSGSSITQALKLYQQAATAGTARVVDRDRLMRLWTRAEVLRLTNIRATDARERGTPGPEGSIGKLATTELNKDVYELCVTLLGPEGALYDDYTMIRPDIGRIFTQRDIRKLFLRSRANSIEGGSSEIMRNILGERVLGLPAEPRVDKDTPWSELAR